MRKWLFYFLCFIVHCNFLNAEISWFPQGDELFKKLLADPEEVKISAEYFRLNDSNTVDVSLGHTWGGVRWSSGAEGSWWAQLDISGVMTPRFLVSTNVNQLEAIDFFLNLPLEIRRGIFSARATLYHESGHLGDNLIARTGRERITYSREGFQLLAAVELWKSLRLYGGLTELLHNIPDVGNLELQAGFEWRGADLGLFKDHESLLYLAEDLQSKEEVGWNINTNTEIGAEFGFKGNNRGLRIFLNYFDGHSTFGQFFKEREEKLGGGLGFDY